MKISPLILLAFFLFSCEQSNNNFEYSTECRKAPFEQFTFHENVSNLNQELTSELFLSNENYNLLISEIPNEAFMPMSAEIGKKTNMQADYAMCIYFSNDKILKSNQLLMDDIEGFSLYQTSGDNFQHKFFVKDNGTSHFKEERAYSSKANFLAYNNSAYFLKKYFWTNADERPTYIVIFNSDVHIELKKGRDPLTERIIQLEG